MVFNPKDHAHTVASFEATGPNIRKLYGHAATAFKIGQADIRGRVKAKTQTIGGIRNDARRLVGELIRVERIQTGLIWRHRQPARRKLDKAGFTAFARDQSGYGGGLSVQGAKRGFRIALPAHAALPVQPAIEHR